MEDKKIGKYRRNKTLKSRVTVRQEVGPRKHRSRFPAVERTQGERRARIGRRGCVVSHNSSVLAFVWICLCVIFILSAVVYLPVGRRFQNRGEVLLGYGRVRFGSFKYQHRLAKIAWCTSANLLRINCFIKIILYLYYNVLISYDPTWVTHKS